MERAVPTLRRGARRHHSLVGRAAAHSGIAPETGCARHVAIVGASEALGRSVRNASGGGLAPRALPGTMHHDFGTFHGKLESENR